MAQAKMALVNIGYNLDLVMPVADACDLIKLLQKADRFDTHWRKSEDGGTAYYLGGDIPNVTMSFVDPDKYAIAKANGARPKDAE